MPLRNSGALEGLLQSFWLHWPHLPNSLPAPQSSLQKEAGGEALGLDRVHEQASVPWA